MVGPPAVGAGEPAGEPAHQLLGGDLDVDDPVHPAAERLQEVIQLLGLLDRPWKAVQQDPVGHVGIREPAPEEFDGHAVRHQLASVHVLLGQPAQLGSVAGLSSHQISGGDLGDAQPLDKVRGLRALAAARWSEQGQDHGRSVCWPVLKGSGSALPASVAASALLIV